MDLFKSATPTIRWGVYLSCAVVSACSSQNNIETKVASPVTAQAIDGYIVDGQVVCDDTNNGRTAAAGRLECPAGTQLITVNGGRDVGFDETATTGGTLFSGSLQAPGDALFVTPVTTLATQLSTTNNVFSRAEYDNAVGLIQNRLGVESLDLTGNPATNTELARINVELNLLAQQFSATSTDYKLAMQAMSGVFRDNTAIDMTDGVALTSAMNQQLINIAPYLSLTSTEEINTGNQLSAEIGSIQTAKTIEELEENIEQVNTPAAFSIDVNTPMIGIYTSYYYQQYGSYNSYYRTRETTYTTAEFLSDNSDSGGFMVSASRWNADRMAFHTDALTIDQTLSSASINIALEVESLLDSRYLSVIIRDVQLSMTEGDNSSVTLDLPQGTVLDAQYIDRNGVITQVTELADEDLIGSAADGKFSIDIDDIRRELADQGYPDFMRQAGHYRVSVVLEGVKFELTDNGEVTQPEFTTITTGTDTVSGYGIQGYVSLN